MPKTNRRIGTTAGPTLLALVAGSLLLTSVAVAAPSEAAAQEQDRASITIYASVCPTGYQGDAFGDDCYPNPAGGGLTFTLTNLATGERFAGTTGADGFAAIEGIAAGGSYRLTDDLPDATSAAAVICSKDGAPFPVASLGAGTELDLTTDDDLRCDWSVIPLASPATPSAARPGGPDGPSFPVYVLDCAAPVPEPVPIPPTDAFPPAGCEPGGGVAVIVETEDGVALGRCTTGDDGSCTVPIPVDRPVPAVVARQDGRTVRDGYEPTQVEIREEIVGEYSAAAFVNVPTAGPESSPFPVYAATCPAEPEPASPFAGRFPPEGCLATQGMTVVVTLRDGSEVGACTIDAEGRCRVEVPFAATVIVTADASTLPPEYAPRQNPITTRVITEFAGAVFVNLPGPAGTPGAGAPSAGDG